LYLLFGLLFAHYLFAPAIPPFIEDYRQTTQERALVRKKEIVVGISLQKTHH